MHKLSVCRQLIGSIGIKYEEAFRAPEKAFCTVGRVQKVCNNRNPVIIYSVGILIFILI